MNNYDETTAAAAVIDEQQIDSTSTTDTGVVDEGGGVETAVPVTDDNFFGEPEKPEPKQAEIHRGEVVGVSHNIAKTGSQSLRITLKSNDLGLVGGPGFTADLWGMNDLFDANAKCWAGGHFDKNGLPTDSLGKNDKGNDKKSQRQMYATNIHSEKNDAVLDTLRKAAAEEGRTPSSLGLSSATNPEEYVANLNVLLAGTQIYIIRRPESNPGNPQFDGALKVKTLLPTSVAATPRFDGITKNLRKMYE